MKLNKALACTALTTYMFLFTLSACGGGSKTVNPTPSQPDTTTTTKTHSLKIVGYLPMDSTSANSVQLSQMRWKCLTHIILSSGRVSSTGHLNTRRLDRNIDNTISAAHNNNVKVLMQLYSLSLKGLYFTEVLDDAAKRAVLVQDIIAYSKSKGLDGVDINYEERSGWGTTEAENLYNLAKEIRAAAPSGFLITAAVTEYDPYVSGFFDVLDFASLMSYDHNVWSTANSQHASYTSFQSNFETLMKKFPNIDKKKLLGGVPFYGYTWDTVSYPAAIGHTPYGVTFASILSHYGIEYADTDEVAGKASGTKTLYNGRFTIANKCAYINSNGYGGIMIWQLLQDASSGSYSLLKIIDKNLN
ncbi:MAG: glycosyl hydrolase family 18 protein [Bacteroidales bacterium]|nr:glycosyl hydrolase family 18 protein [Bacteroidales bacterium]MCI1733156.1 glycosyl hydrolase family 18 protein [Bacteroidales bacterium]